LLFMSSASEDLWPLFCSYSSLAHWLSLRPGSCGVNRTGLLLCGVTREIGELGVKKERIGKRTRYFGTSSHGNSDNGDNPWPPEWSRLLAVWRRRRGWTEGPDLVLN
jgi:hypothetical protein